MEIQFKGANCIQISTKEGVLITDPEVKLLGGKTPAWFSKADVCVLTDLSIELPESASFFRIDSPGEYEIKGFAVQGSAARSHLAAKDEPDTKIIYRVSSGEINVAILGHMYPELSDEQLESLGMIDVLIVPVGGNGFTLDAAGAAALTKRIAPKAVIPTHFKGQAEAYPVPQNSVEDFLKELGASSQDVDKLKLKKELLGEGLTVYCLKRT